MTNYQNDTKRQSEIKENQSDFRDVKVLNYKSFFDFFIKKTEKLSMALYMVTDSKDMDDSLKNQIRKLSLGLVSEAYRLSNISKTERIVSSIQIQDKLKELFSFFDIGVTIGFISEMNARILKKEFDLLMNEVLRFDDENKDQSMATKIGLINEENSFFLKEDSLFVSLPEYFKVPNLSENRQTDLSKRHIKDINYNNVFYNKERPLYNKKDIQESVTREERRIKILNFLKDKNFVSIKDISIAVNGCSNKTLQRELNELVSKGQVLKEGEKRWSKYKINQNS